MLRQTAKALERERKPRRVRAGSCGRVQKATRLAQCGGGVGGRGSTQGHPTPWSHTHATPSRGTLCRTRPATGGARVSLAPRQAGPRGHSHLPAPSQGPWTPGSGTTSVLKEGRGWSKEPEVSNATWRQHTPTQPQRLHPIQSGNPEPPDLGNTHLLCSLSLRLWSASRRPGSTSAQPHQPHDMFGSLKPASPLETFGRS